MSTSLFAFRTSKSQIPIFSGDFHCIVPGKGTAVTPPSGCFSYTLYKTHTRAAGEGRDNEFAITLTFNNDRYGDYTEVNPLYLSCKFYIKY